MTVTAKDGGFPVDLVDTAQALKRRFADAASIQVYLQDEAAFWARLWDRIQSDRNLMQRSLASHLIENAGRQTTNEALRLFKIDVPSTWVDALNHHYSNRAIASHGKYGAILEDDAYSSKQLVGVVFAVGVMLGIPRLYQNLSHPSGMTLEEVVMPVNGALIIAAKERVSSAERKQLASVSGALQAEVANAEQVRRDLETWQAEKEAQIETTLEGYRAESTQDREAGQAQLAALMAELRAQLADLRSDATSRITGLASSTEAEIADFKQKVRIDVVNEVPTSFWNTKASGHLWTALGSGVVFAVAVGLAIWWVDRFAIDLVVDATRRINEVAPGSTLAGLTPFVLISIPALAAAWVLRHISRVIIQNLSLHADAKLRGTITSTFRALAADRAMTEAELAIALQALFRPIDGKDHAEVAPPSLADILRLGDGKGS